MTRSIVLAVGIASVAAVTLAARSSSGGGGTATTPATATPANAAPTGAPANAGGGFGPVAAASGEIAQIAGTTVQVQNTNTQTAVTYSGKTTFSISTATTRSAIKVGSCIVATTGSTAGSSANSVRITDCARQVGGFGTGPGRFRPGGAPSGVPSAFPSGARPSAFRSGARPSGFPSGAPGRAGGFGRAVFGKVSAISGSTITVTPLARGASGAGGKQTVQVSSATKYTTTVRTTHKALKVGLCAVVQGATMSNGAVQARSISLSHKSGGTCSAGFPGAGAGRPNG